MLGRGGAEEMLVCVGGGCVRHRYSYLGLAGNIYFVYLALNTSVLVDGSDCQTG